MTNKNIYLTYSTDNKVINLVFKIYNDDYISNLNLINYEMVRAEQIVKLVENIKYIFEKNNFIVKNRMFLFENSDYVIKYEFNNNNNNLILNIYKYDMWLFSFNFNSRVFKTNSDTQIDILTNVFNKISL
jgi:hypothetical protein